MLTFGALAFVAERTKEPQRLNWQSEFLQLLSFMVLAVPETPLQLT